MRIYGHFKTSEAAYVDATLLLPELELKSGIEFLIDTGAARTVIMEKDSEKLAIDYNKLSKSTIGLIGIGGVIETYEAKNASLHFIVKTGEEHAINIDRLRIARIPKRGPMIPSMPSIIGRDILNKYKLEYDRRNDSVFITDE